jgi:hypothetical protein
MDLCDDGSPADALEQLAQRHPAVSRATIESDVLATVRSLLARNVIVPVQR